jgi:peptide/nickel transport system ATP-binding protein
MLAVEDLHVGFTLADGEEVHAVRGVSFSVQTGERFGLVGESGCGKSTTLMALMGLLPPNAWVSGRVLVDGQEVLSSPVKTMQGLRWRRVALVPQAAMNALNPVRTIGSQMLDPMLLHGTVDTRRAGVKRSRELLELVGLPADRVERYPHELSGGMRQRATIAMALVCDPQVLLADEPTTALDVIVQAQVLALLGRLCAELGLALVLVTHDLGAIARVCGSAAVMREGEIVELATVEALYHAPQHPYTRQLFEATPTLREDADVATLLGRPDA